VIESCG
ncbi:methyl-accepting chemotaxis (MCP) signaling domain protein, partial [Vibrio cholerae HC-50A2]